MSPFEDYIWWVSGRRGRNNWCGEKYDWKQPNKLLIGTSETGRLRIDPNQLVAEEIEAEQDAVQNRVRKGPVLPTADQVMTILCDALPTP